MNTQFEKIGSIIKSYTRFVLTTHINPDGDGLGTEVALALYLQRQGKQAVILNCDASPDNYNFLNDLSPILHYDPIHHSKFIENAEVIIVLDTNHPDRLASMKQVVVSSTAYKLCIDHHLEPGEFADLYLLDESATATGEIIYYLLQYLSRQSFDRSIAIALYTAIMTDTGSFRYPKTDSEVHTIIADLIKSGADPVHIYEQVYECGPANRTRLLGIALAGLKTEYNGRLAYIVLTREMFESTVTSEDDTDAFVPYTLAIQGVQIGLMFSELQDIVKVNFRSKGDIRINELAKQFGGNGHKNAAGARISNVRLSEIISQVIQKAGSYLR